MGFYKTVYDCGDDCYCIGEFCTLDMSSYFTHICIKHTLKRGNTFNYCFNEFLCKFTILKGGSLEYLLSEVIDFKENYKGKILVRLKVKYDYSLLNQSKNIIFSEFNDCYAFEKIDGGYCIFTYFFLEERIERFYATNADYDYRTGKIVKIENNVKKNDEKDNNDNETNKNI